VEALQGGGYDVVPIDIVQTREEEITSLISKNNIDIAFIALHGRLGEDGTIQSILENLFIPYTGSGVQASRLAINKVLTQTLLKNNGIAVPANVILDKEDSPSTESILKNIGDLPWVVKPACEGSSIGISLVRNFSEFNSALRKARGYGWQVLIERFIVGRELTIGILEDRPLPIIEICPPQNFFDFTAKYNAGLTEYIIPANLPKELEWTLQEQALKAHRALGCRDISRVDMILAADGQSYILEINTIPGFTSMSLLPKAAKAAGLDFNQLCLKLVELAYGKKKETQTISV
jgi:D-alanine-D-alanine ligase